MTDTTYLIEKKLCLNLTGESVIIDNDYVDMITSKSGMRLETVLEFVRLPYWKPPNAERYRSKRAPNSSDSAVALKKFPDPYIGIFDWLWDECNVRKIFCLEVDDGGPEPHTNRGIQRSLKYDEDRVAVRDFEIEVWKWKKFDICVDMIATVAPKANEVHLFSSGNTAVLRGWSCRSGLAKLTELEKLVVVIQPKVSTYLLC
jgi:hypothetical protein